MSVLYLALGIYVAVVALVLYIRPASMFHPENGSWKEFGIVVGRSNTVFPFWMFAIIWAFVSYAIATLLHVGFAHAAMNSSNSSPVFYEQSVALPVSAAYSMPSNNTMGPPSGFGVSSTPLTPSGFGVSSTPLTPSGFGVSSTPLTPSGFGVSSTPLTPSPFGQSTLNASSSGNSFLPTSMHVNTPMPTFIPPVSNSGSVPQLPGYYFVEPQSSGLPRYVYFGPDPPSLQNLVTRSS